MFTANAGFNCKILKFQNLRILQQRNQNAFELPLYCGKPLQVLCFYWRLSKIY